jgi:two-component sensor histidine kinase
VRLFDEDGGLRDRPVLAHGFAIGLVAFATGLRAVLHPVLPPGFPFLTFFPVVILTAFVAGTAPAITCAILSGLAAWFFFIPPESSFVINAGTAIAMGLYVFVVAVDVWLVHLMQVAARRLRAERERTAALYEGQKTLFEELQHRVANNMSFVAALLQMQRGKLRDDPSAGPAALDDAMERLQTLSRVHRRLYDPAAIELPVDSYFRELCADLIASSNTPNVAYVVEMPEIRMDISRLMTLSLLVTELVTNALKHAFVNREAGRITLSLAPTASDRLALEVTDDGVGLSSAAPPTGKGLGTRIVGGLVRQLGATMTTHSTDGTTVRIEFPA